MKTVSKVKLIQELKDSAGYSCNFPWCWHQIQCCIVYESSQVHQ